MKKYQLVQHMYYDKFRLYAGTYRGSVYYNYLKDGQASTTNLVKQDGTLAAAYDYSDFGETTEITGSSLDNQICYTGGIYDKETGLYYLNARYYDPEIGRFISQDSYRGKLDIPSQWHLYAYCANNPINYVDPSGHLSFPGQIHARVVKDIDKRYSWAETHVTRIDYGKTKYRGRQKSRYGYCDVIRIKGKYGYIWEIKRVTCRYSTAKKQLEGYVSGTYHANPSLKLRTGNGAITGNSFSYKTSTATYYVEYANYGGGIIYYDYSKVVKWKRVAGIACACIIVAGVIVTIPYTGGASAGVLLPV